MPDYTILVCPICGEQVEEDYEYGAYCSHERFGQVEPIEVKVEPVNLPGLMALGRFRIEQEQREQDFTDAARRWFRNLPKEEQERIREERLAAMSPDLRRRAERQEAEAALLERMLERATPLLSQPAFDWTGTSTVIPTAGTTQGADNG